MFALSRDIVSTEKGCSKHCVGIQYAMSRDIVSTEQGKGKGTEQEYSEH